MIVDKQMTSNRHLAAAAAAEGAHSVYLCQLSLLLLSVCCLSFVNDLALVHKHDVLGLYHVQGQVEGCRLWHVALEGGWPHQPKVSVTFTMERLSETSKFGCNWHSALVNSCYSEYSSITMRTGNLMKLLHLMSDYLGYTLNITIQLWNIPAQDMISLTTKRHYLRQELYISCYKQKNVWHKHG